MQALFFLYMHLYNKYGDFATAYNKMTETIRSRFDGINSVSTRQKLDTNYQFILQLTDQSVRTLTLMFLRVGRLDPAKWYAKDGFKWRCGADEDTRNLIRSDSDAPRGANRKALIKQLNLMDPTFNRSEVSSL